MVNNTLITSAKLYRALGDPTRLSVVERLVVDGEASVTELSKPFALTLPAIIKHLRVLESVGLISMKKQGNERRVMLVPGTLEYVAEKIGKLNSNWKKNYKNRNAEWEEYRKTKNDATREGLLKKYLYLVKYVAGRISISLPPNVEFNDLVSYGVLGLFEAINRYDCSHGDKFETFAVTLIRDAIVKELKKNNWASHFSRKDIISDGMSDKCLEEKRRKLFSSQEVARSARIKVNELNTIFRGLDSKDLLPITKSGIELKDKNALAKQVFEKSLIEGRFKDYPKSEMESALTIAINGLSEKEKLVVYLYYYENLTLKEIGEILEVSESRVCQIHAQVVVRMRESLSKATSERMVMKDE